MYVNTCIQKHCNTLSKLIAHTTLHTHEKYTISEPSLWSWQSYSTSSAASQGTSFRSKVLQVARLGVSNITESVKYTFLFFYLFVYVR